MHAAAVQETLTTGSDHLINLGNTDWAFWRWVCLRGSGFPFPEIFKLTASPALALATDAIVAAIEAREIAQQKALQWVNSTLDNLRAAGRWDDKPARKALLDARCTILRGEVPSALPPDLVPSELLEEFSAAIRQLEAKRNNYQAEFAASSLQTTAAIREIAASPEFREAVIWQNRVALPTALDPLRQTPLNGSARGSKQKQREELVASYWQRYCTKNDTIGFFGPVAWARFVSSDELLTMRPGKSLLAKRSTYWETWAMTALGEVIAQKDNVQQWIPPIILPFLRVEGTVLLHPMWGAVRITAKQSVLLRECDGRQTAKQIAAKLLEAQPPLFRTANEVYQALHELSTKKFIFWKFNIPISCNPERDLRQAVQRIEERETHDWAVGLLDEVESARAKIEACAGNTPKLDEAFGDLEQIFTRLTGRPANRLPGKVYAGRTVLYEDCRRDVEVLLGPELLKSLSGPLSLLLQACRWFTSRIAQEYEEKLSQIYSGLVRSSGSNVVDAATLWSQVVPLFLNGSEEIMAPIHDEFREKWERVLPMRSGREPITYSCEELREGVMAEFAPLTKAWIDARYHSPDIMIAASSEEAIRRGDFYFVLGELHVSKNTIDTSLFVNQHPRPEELMAAARHDLGDWNVAPTGLLDDQLGSRNHRALIGQSDLVLECLADSFATDRSMALPVSSLVVERQRGELVATTRDGSFKQRLIDLTGSLLSRLAIGSFRMISTQDHVPRISIDHLVIKRESWRFSASELQFAHCPDSAERFLQARRWKHAAGMPRFVFFKVPVESKPAYLDFESPILLDIFAKMIRRTIEAKLPQATIEISEMLPGPEELWLADALDRRYTSEFRFVAVDQPALPNAKG
jgi:Lantibiotic dehydratase, N terminus